ncbi:hypothetical protein GCM10027456_82960 [Kineosporia babensis]
MQARRLVQRKVLTGSEQAATGCVGLDRMRLHRLDNDHVARLITDAMSELAGTRSRKARRYQSSSSGSCGIGVISTRRITRTRPTRFHQTVTA